MRPSGDPRRQLYVKVVVVKACGKLNAGFAKADLFCVSEMARPWTYTVKVQLFRIRKSAPSCGDKRYFKNLGLNFAIGWQPTPK